MAITSPIDQSTVTSPVHVQATATSPYRIKVMQVYLDGTKVYEVKAGILDSNLTAPNGPHRVTVRARDFRNRWFESSVSITVVAPLTPLAVTTTSLPSAVLGTAYSAGLAASGGTPAYTWGLAAGALPPGLLLAATSGTISGVPSSSGTYGFTARVADSGVPAQTTTSALSITVASTPAPSGGPTPGANDVIIFQDDFETGTLNKWDETVSQYAIESDPASVHGGAFSMRGTISAGHNYGSLNKWFMPGYDEVYVRLQVMFSTGFLDTGMHLFWLSGNRIDDKWSASGRAGIRPNGSDFFATMMDPEYPSQHNQVKGLYPLQFYSYWPEMTCPASYDPVANRNCYGNVIVQTAPQVENTAGVWHEVVVRMKMNAVGQHDGLQELWVDGTKKISQTGMRWRDTTDLRLNQFAVQMYVDQAVQMQLLWVDDVVVWTPGPDPDPWASPNARPVPVNCSPVMTGRQAFRVFATCNIGDDALNLLRQRGYQLEVYPGPEAPPKPLIVEKVGSGIDGLITTLRDPIDGEVFAAGKGTLKVVAQIAVGFDNINRTDANRYRIPFTHTADVLTEATAEFALFILASVARKLWPSEHLVRDQQWGSWHPFLPFLGDEVTGKTLAVIGTGRIGLALIRKCTGFDMNMLCYDPVYQNQGFVKSVQQLMDTRHALGLQKEKTSIKYVGLEEALSGADYVSLHVPLLREGESETPTYHLINQRTLQLMRPTAYLVNTSRGPVVDEKALARGLKEGWIAGAALDVFEKEPLPPDSPLRDPAIEDRCRIFHHFASGARITRLSTDPDKGMAGRTVQGLIDVLEGNYGGDVTKMPYVVNKEAFGK